MYKIVTVRDYGKEIEFEEFDSKMEAISKFVELSNEAYNRYKMIKEVIKKPEERITFGDCIFAREDKYHSEYILLIGEDIQETRHPSKYEQSMREYVNHLL